MQNRINYLQTVIASQRSPIEVFMGMQQEPNSALIIDVRIGNPAFLKEKINDALEIPLTELHANLDKLDKNKLIYVSTWNYGCNLAKQASLILLSNGFNVMEIAGGNENWKATGLPMVELEQNEVEHD